MTKVLIFETDHAFAVELRTELSQLGCTVRVFKEGSTGLIAAANDKPDLILLSVELPRMNGFSVCNKLKKDANLQTVPVVLMSSESTPETFAQHQQLRMRADAYLHKPIVFGELLAQIQALVPLGIIDIGNSGGADDDIAIDDTDFLGGGDSLIDAHGDTVNLEHRTHSPTVGTAPPKPALHLDLDRSPTPRGGVVPVGPNAAAAAAASTPRRPAIPAPAAPLRNTNTPPMRPTPESDMSADLLPYGLGDDDEDIDTVVGPHPTELAHVAGMAPKQPNAAIAPAQPTPDGPNAAAAQARVTQLEHVLSKANEELAL